MIKSGLNSIPRPKYVGAAAGPAPGSYATTILATSGLFAFWELADASGTTSPIDSGPNNLTATVNGTVTFGSSGQNGKTSAAFGGSTNGDIGVANNVPLGLLSAFTIEAWALPTGNNDGVSLFSEIFSSNTLRMALGFDSAAHDGTSDLLFFGFYNGGSGGWHAAQSSSTLTQNSWQYFVGTNDGTNLNVYLNASLVGGPVSAAAIPGSNHAGSVIGARHDSTIDFKGSIQYLAIYSRALTTIEISNHYAAI